MHSNGLLSDLHRARVARVDGTSQAYVSAKLVPVSVPSIATASQAAALAPAQSAATSGQRPPISAADWAARPKRQPYQPPAQRSAGQSAAGRRSHPPITDTVFFRHLQQGIRQYRDSYDEHARAHFDLLRAPAGRERRSHEPFAGVGAILKLATERAAEHVDHITEYVASAPPSEGCLPRHAAGGVRLAPPNRQRE
jgi:hypothetical protein